MSGIFITFEGLDGSGKSEQLRRMAGRLRSLGREVVETCDPGGADIAWQIRQILLDPANAAMQPTSELLLYYAARAETLAQVVDPALQRGAIVLCDRWADSTLAYQGHGRQLGEGIIERLESVSSFGRRRRPDLTIWLDVDLEVSLLRARERNRATAATGTRMDGLDRPFYERVLRGYRLTLIREPYRFVRVDGNGALNDVELRVAAAWREWSERRKPITSVSAAGEGPGKE
jgi:dTMP kinase